MREHDEAVRQERWPWLEAVNMIEMLSYLGTSPLAEQHVTQEIEWVITGVQDNTFNGVVRAQLSEATVDRVIDEVAQRFQERRVWHLWFLAPDSRPADLAHRLEAHGWSRLREGVGMAIDLSTPTEPFPPPPGLTVERVVDEAGLVLWGTFHRYLENQERDEPRERLYSSLGLSREQPLRHYIARLDDEPAGALSLFLGQEAAGIYNVEAAPHLQRRGVGTAMTHWVLEEARRLGAQIGVVGPTRESRSMYERLGFVLHREVLPMFGYPVESASTMKRCGRTRCRAGASQREGNGRETPLGCSLLFRTESSRPVLLLDQGPLALVRMCLREDLLAQVKTRVADADALGPDRQEGDLALWFPTERATQALLLLARFGASAEARHAGITDGDVGASNETLGLIQWRATKRTLPRLSATLHEAAPIYSHAPAARSTQNV